MKKVFSLVIACIMLLSTLTGCADTDSNEKAAENSLVTENGNGAENNPKPETSDGGESSDAMYTVTEEEWNAAFDPYRFLNVTVKTTEVEPVGIGSYEYEHYYKKTDGENFMKYSASSDRYTYEYVADNIVYELSIEGETRNLEKRNSYHDKFTCDKDSAVNNANSLFSSYHPRELKEAYSSATYNSSEKMYTVKGIKNSDCELYFKNGYLVKIVADYGMGLSIFYELFDYGSTSFEIPGVESEPNDEETWMYETTYEFADTTEYGEENLRLIKYISQMYATSGYFEEDNEVNFNREMDKLKGYEIKEITLARDSLGSPMDPEINVQVITEGDGEKYCLFKIVLVKDGEEDYNQRMIFKKNDESFAELRSVLNIPENDWSLFCLSKQQIMDMGNEESGRVLQEYLTMIAKSSYESGSPQPKQKYDKFVLLEQELNAEKIVTRVPCRCTENNN